MKEFRVTKCLENGEINEYAIFADGSRKKMILTDILGNQYFEVDNEFNTDSNSCLRFSFSGRISDAIDTIKAGNGDCIAATRLFGRHEEVLYYLNRKIGEEYRKQTIEGWKDAKFGWTIEYGNKNSFSGYAVLNTQMDNANVFAPDRPPMIFETEEEAKRYMKELIEKAKCYAKELANKLMTDTDEDMQSKMIEQTLEEIEANTGTKRGILTDFVFDMLTLDGQLKSPECNLDQMGYRIIQYPIH